MIAMLLEQSLRGTLAVGVAWLANRWLAGRMKASARRVWWWLAALAFLVPWKLPVLPAAAGTVLPPGSALEHLPLMTRPLAVTLPAGSTVSVPWLVLIWLAGVLVFLLWLAAQTLLVSRRWSRERLCTDSRLLELLEDCKRLSGVTAPVGLVVTERLAVPALLGWLRPRILLPADLARTLTVSQLSGVLLHELVHFRWLDIPAGWLFALVNALHWFNPFAWLAVGGWKNFREEAADEIALDGLADADGEIYGATLLRILRADAGARIPFGSLAIGESMRNLRTRMIMIKNYRQKSACYGMAGLLAAALMAVAMVVPARAETEEEVLQKQALAFMQLCDDGKYAHKLGTGCPIGQKSVSRRNSGKNCAAPRGLRSERC
ncbi:MAG: M56 family metallopeptidase [Verrucomicrobiales bacterium]|jgi:beta-lactamase regulating signal transducer with metallopeptidase domain|nr:M56 family metallopeptidase [Verrucomicrobiales bacterium]